MVSTERRWMKNLHWSHKTLPSGQQVGLCCLSDIACLCTAQISDVLTHLSLHDEVSYSLRNGIDNIITES